MYLAKITFHSPDGMKKTDIEDLADIYLDTIAHTGQIGVDAFLNWVNGRLTAYIEASRPDALLEKYHTEWGKKSLREIREKTGSNPEVTFLDDEMPKRFPRWTNAPFLVLYASFWDDNHPIRRGSDGYPFPAYQFPLDQGEMHH